jgi:hypothetical protein
MLSGSGSDPNPVDGVLTRFGGRASGHPSGAYKYRENVAVAKYAAFLVVECPAFLGSDAFLEAGERLSSNELVKIRSRHVYRYLPKPDSSVSLEERASHCRVLLLAELTP